jgi:hypothetical protein
MQDRHSSRADSFFPRYTLFSVGGMAQGGEWPRVGNGSDSYSSRADSFALGYTLFGVGGMAQGGE